MALFGKDVTPEGKKKQSTEFLGAVRNNVSPRMAMTLPRWDAASCAPKYIEDGDAKSRLGLDGVGGGVPGDGGLAEIGFVGHVAGQRGVVTEDGVFGDLLVVAHALEKFPEMRLFFVPGSAAIGETFLHGLLAGLGIVVLVHFF